MPLYVARIGENQIRSESEYDGARGQTTSWRDSRGLPGLKPDGLGRGCASESHMATGKSIGDSGDPDSPGKRSYPAIKPLTRSNGSWFRQGYINPKPHPHPRDP